MVDHLVTLKIIADECLNNKTNLLCCFVEFKKYFDTMSITNLWNMLEELKLPLELRVVMVIFYENVIVEFRNTKGWSK